jgi:hypothetical protein
LENKGILVYCVAERFDDSLSDITGLDAAGKLYAVGTQGLFAIASDVGLEEYGEESMAQNGEDIDWLKEKAQIFMDVILSISAVSSIIPMKFLTIFNSEERVRAMVVENLEQFTETFKKINHRDELSFKVYCDHTKYRDKAMGEEIAAFEKTLAGKPKGASFFLKKKFEQELDGRIQDKIYAAANDFAKELSDYAAEMKSNKILAKEITGISTPMILNLAFLVDKDHETELGDAVGKLEAEHSGSGFSFELSGPWPPYSFCV